MYFKIRSYIKSNILKSFFRENSDLIFLNSSFCFKNSYLSEKFFKFCNFYNIYSRFSNPTNIFLEKKIAFFEKSKYCLTFSSGMAAIFSIFINFLLPNDIFYTTINIFGSTINFFLNFLFRFNLFVIFINFLNLNSFYLNIFSVKMVFFETPSNPLIKIYDINFISYLSLKYKFIFFLDNTFSTFVLQNPFVFKIDFITHSCTKFFDGQGRVLGGAVLTNNYFLFLNIFSFLRFSGFSISSFDSWIIFKSLDTIFLRIRNQIFNSYIFLKILKYNLFIFKIFYSGLLNYNEYKLFFFQQIFGNSLFSFVIKGLTYEMIRINSWKIIDNNNFFLNTSNLGDILSIITNCSVTTHSFLSFLEKIILNIYDSFLRLSFGFEDFFDIYYNLILNFNCL
ncbi:MAG: PLP-dependent transferase [Candidatus Nasuia deltocephalinicola]